MRRTCFVVCLLAVGCAAGADEAVTTSQTAPAPQDATYSLLTELLPQARPMVEPIPGGEIDWTRGQVIAVGEGKAQGVSGQQIDMAKRAAYLSAARNAALMLGGVRVGPGGRFKDIEHAAVRVEAVLKDFQEVASDFDARTRTATVKLALPIYGAKGVVKVMSLAPGSLVEMAARPASPKKTGVKLIVIDARGTGFQACILPRIINSSDKAVFDAATSPSYKASASQPVVYVRMIESESRPQTAASAPKRIETKGGVVVIAATASPAEDPGTITLKDSDAENFMEMLAGTDIVNQGRLVVIADPPAKK